MIVLGKNTKRVTCFEVLSCMIGCLILQCSDLHTHTLKSK